MSALPPRADMVRRISNVCFVPKADMGSSIRSSRRPHAGGSGHIVGHAGTIEPLEGVLIESGGRQVKYDTTAG